MLKTLKQQHPKPIQTNKSNACGLVPFKTHGKNQKKPKTIPERELKGRGRGGGGGLAFAVPVQKTNKLAPAPPLWMGLGWFWVLFLYGLSRLHEECHQNNKNQADVCQTVLAEVWNC